MARWSRKPFRARVAAMSELAFRTCPLCEATCGLEIEVKDDGGIGRIRGDRDDVFSHGFICPKGSTLKQLHEDPDRLRTPMVRGHDGELHAATWDEAFAEIARRLPPIIEHHGRARGRDLLGEPHRAQPVGVALQPLSRARPRHEQRVFGEHRRPTSQGDQQRVAVRHEHQLRRTRPRPHLVPAAARRQPNRVQRQPCHRARLARSSRAHHRTRRPRRRGRPQAHEDRGTSERARPDPPRHRRPVPDGDGARALRRRTRRTRPSRRIRRRRASGRAGGARLLTRSRCTGDRDRRRHHQAPDARAGSRRDRCGIRPHRHVHPGVRHARELARRRAQHPHR